MATSAAARANAAFVDEDYDLALALYKQAIDASPEDAALFSQRAQTHIKLENFIDAADDAGKAIELDPKTGRHHHRKGVALFNLEEYESAKAAFEAGQALDNKNSSFKTWIRKCNAELDDEASQENQTYKQQGTASSSADGFASSAAPATPESAPFPPASSNPSKTPHDADAPSMPPPVDPNQPKYRHQWFQTQTVVEVAVLAKNMTKERVDIHIDKQHLRVVIRDAEGEQEYELDVELYGQVDTAASKHELLKSKTEIRLKKADAIKWPTLEKSSQKADLYAKAPNAVAPPVQQPKPAYPSSFNRRSVDWDKLESDIKKDEKDEKLEGDAALQKLFKDIYGGADEDTRRAMNKSFQESNGTVLSTNWKDIGKKKTECTPPTGMEAKRYGKD